MKVKLQHVLDGTYEATTLSQMLVVTRIKELHEETKRLREERAYVDSERARIDHRQSVIPLVGEELLALLEDMPDEAYEVDVADGDDAEPGEVV